MSTNQQNTGGCGNPNCSGGCGCNAEIPCIADIPVINACDWKHGMKVPPCGLVVYGGHPYGNTSGEENTTNPATGSGWTSALTSATLVQFLASCGVMAEPPAEDADTWGTMTPLTEEGNEGKVEWRDNEGQNPQYFYNCAFIDAWKEELACCKEVTREDPTLGRLKVQVDAGTGVAGTMSFSLADLEAMGMRSCHNTVRIRMDVDSNLSTDANTPATLHDVKLTLDGTNFKVSTDASVPQTSEQGSDSSSKSVPTQVPLGANGLQFTVDHSVTGGTANANSATTATVQILGFKCTDKVST